MKKYVVFLISLGCLVGLFSCTTDVDLYCDYKDVPIIYGMIDAYADTNYVKITKAFCGSNDNPINANEVALISDSSNYPCKLDVRIVELKANYGQTYNPTGRIFVLDTLTIHDKNEGVFYSPDQLLYFTTERFKTNNGGDKYKYKLVVVKPDGDTVTAVTTPVGGNAAILSASASFQAAHSEATNRLLFRSSPEGVLYDFKMQFNYREQHVGQEMVRKHVSWSYGARPLSAYEKATGSEDLYYLYYSVNTLFGSLSNAIGNDTVWDESHPNVIRHIDDFVITMSVGGRELYESYEMSNVIENGYMVANFSNVDGGYGLFSSRVNVVRTIRISASTKLDLFKMPWGFVEE